jgi:hypothetical protein
MYGSEVCLSRQRCPLWVISRQTTAGKNPPLSALVQKRTNMGATGLSAKCQKQTHAPQQQRGYSITSSALVSSVGGTVRPRAFAVFILMTNSNLFGA